MAPPIIGTHDGRFHADEALAIFMLKKLPEYYDATIVRSREPDIWKSCTVLVDVGGVFDEKSLRFDHHQRGFEETFNNKYQTKLSSAGLVYKYFGKRVLTEVITAEYAPQSITTSQIDTLYDKIYSSLIEEYDAVDNGISAYPSDLMPKYKIGSTSVFSRVNDLNPEWNAVDVSAEHIQDSFIKAVEITGESLVSSIKYLWGSWLPARDIVFQAVSERFSIHPSGKCIYLYRNCPWKDHLYDIEHELGIVGEIFYCLYPDALHDKCMIQAVSQHSQSFTSRMALPETWRGLRDLELDRINGISGCVFAHATGFIGGHANKEGAISMADASLKYHQASRN